MMRIALIGPVYPYRGGMVHYTMMLYRVLQQHQDDVLLVSFKRQYPAWLFPGESDKDPSQPASGMPGAKYWIDSLNPLTWLATFWRILRYRPDVFVLQWWTTFWTPVWLVIGGLYRLFTRKPLLMLAHCVLPHEAKWWDHGLAWLGLRVGTRFVVHSEEEKGRLLGLVPKADVTVMSMPVFDFLGEAQISRREARRRLNLPQDGPVLLFFGMIRPYKGLPDLLEALPRVKARLPEIKLLIAGEFWEDKHKYVQLIERLQIADAVIVDSRYIPDEEVPLYFSAADVLVLPYRQITGSAVVKLAFGLGCPVIATRVGGLRAVVRDGENGLLIPPQDPEALVAAILRYFEEDLAASMRDAVKRDRERFSWAVLLDVLESLRLA